MKVARTLVLFAVAVAVVFGLGVGIGRAVGPLDDGSHADEPTSDMRDHGPVHEEFEL